MVTIALFCAMARLDGQKISLDIPAMRAEMALRQMGSAAHLTLTVSPQTANDVLMLRFKDVPIDEAMRRIATADDATWKQEGDAYRLIRTSDQQRNQEAKQLKEDLDHLTKEIAKKVAALNKMPQWGPDAADQLATKVAAHVKTFNPQNQNGNWYQRSTELGDQAPFGRAMTRIMASLDPKDLVSLPPRIKTVWSTNPTATQLPMPPQVTPIFNQFLQENLDWSTAVDKHQLKAPTFGNTTYWVGSFGDFSSSKATSSNVAVVLLSAYSYGARGGGSIQLELAAFDSKGKKIADSQENLFASEMNDIMTPEKTDSGERKITLTGDAKILADAGPQRNSSATKPLPADLLARLLDPEHHEPLETFVGSCMRQAADIKGVNLVAHLSDQMVLGLMAAAQQPVSVERYLSFIDTMGGKAEIKDGWMMVEPGRPLEARESQVDRKELAKYLQRIADPRHISLDERAAFALALPEQEDNMLPEMLSNIIRPADNREYFDQNMLKLYGLITPEQRSRMLGEGLPCGALSDKQRTYLNRMVYGQWTNLQYQPPASRNGQTPDFDLYYNGILHEPTVSMPNGIPPKGLVKLSQTNESVVVTGETDRGQWVQPGQTMTAGSLAWQKYSQEHVDLFPWMSDDNQKMNLDKLSYGKHLELNFTFQLTPELSMGQSLEDKDTSTFQPVTFATLPDDFKKEFQSQYDNYVKSYANMKPGQFGGPARNANIPPVP